MIKNIIFDLNGVFITSPKLSERFEKDFGVSPDEFLPALKGIMERVRKPEAAKLFTLWVQYFEKWGISFTEESFLEYYFTAEKENTDLTTLARKLKAKGYNLFILSNNFRERTKYYDENFKFLRELFKNVYYSWQTGFVKPDAQAFQLILKENSLKPEECLYFDDSEKNIEVAKELGIQAQIFNDESVALLSRL